MKIDLRRPAVRQFLRYLIVGVMNTLVTLVVIYLCKSQWGVNQWVSNGIGYVAGLINSFVWNKLWVFNSRVKGNRAAAEGLKFAVGFLLCYGMQFLVTWTLTTPMQFGMLVWNLGFTMISGYGLATIIGMGVYTVANFVFNRLVTFR